MSEEREEYKFDHFKNIDEVMHYFNYWYKEEDVYSIKRYLSLKDFNYISNKYQELQQENQELKKQLEETDRKLFLTKNELDMRQKSIDNKLNQQKEFIEMLEKEILDSKAGSSQQYYAKEHLRLFKEIIGGKE